MLKKFRITNFAGFQNQFELDLTQVKDYKFASLSTKKGVVNHAIIYGKNGEGKTNLMKALSHAYLVYQGNQNILFINQNAFAGENALSHFEYEFLIENKQVNYSFSLNKTYSIMSEQVTIDDEIVATINREENQDLHINLDGLYVDEDTKISPKKSILSFISNSFELEQSVKNDCFQAFVKFISTIYFKKDSWSNEVSMGTNQNSDIITKIVQKGYVEELQDFLNKFGKNCELAVQRFTDKLMFKYGEVEKEFDIIASSGMKALTELFYIIKQYKNEDTSGLIILDEFDAFYHFDLSKLVVEQLKELNCQFILTTQNTSIISNKLLRPDCYFLMRDNQVDCFADLTQKEIRFANNLEKIFRSKQFEELSLN